MSGLKDMDWIERGRFRRAAKFYRAKLEAISKASLLPAEKLRSIASAAITDGRNKFSKKQGRNRITPVGEQK